MNTKNILFGILLLISSAIIGNAQFTITSTAGSFSSAPSIVKNAPYSIESNTESIRILADGNRIIKKTRLVNYRDSEGRTRNETYNPASSTEPEYVSIIDPVAGKVYSFNPRLKSGLAVPYNQPSFAVSTTNKPSAIQKTTVKTAANGTGSTFATVNVFMSADNSSSGMWFTAADSSNKSSSKTEELGTRTIQGVEAEGQRTVTIIPAGAIGNERAIESVSETWFSKELPMTLLTKRSDPQWGNYTVEVTNIKRVEPDKSLFTVPADYKITDKTVTSKQE